MPIATDTAREVTKATIATGRSKDRTLGSIVFLGGLWFSLFFGVMVLLVLIVDTLIEGAPRFDSALVTEYGSVIRPEATGFRAGILGSLWLMAFTAVFAVPLGIAAAVYLEEFADTRRWWNTLIEVNLQNLAAVPAIVYGLLAVAAMALMGFESTGIVLGGSIALALLILPVIIITTREALRAVPQDIRQGSLALGATTVADHLAADAAVGHPGHRDRNHPGALPGHRRGRPADHRRPRRVGPVRPRGRDEQHHRAADADLLADLELAGGSPHRGVRRRSSSCWS